MGWKLTWGDKSWSEDDLTVAHVMIVGELLGLDEWSRVEPANSPRTCVAVLATLLAAESGASIEECQAALMAQPFSVLVGALTVE